MDKLSSFQKHQTFCHMGILWDQTKYAGRRCYPLKKQGVSEAMD